MRSSAALMGIIAFGISACAGPTPDETADDVVETDTVAIDAAGQDVTGSADRASSPDEAASQAEDPPSATEAPAGEPASDDAPAEDPGDANGADLAAIIPAAFRGEWNADLDACGTGASETRLRVSADEVRFYESVGAVREVEIESERVITVTAQYRGEGDTWQDERRMSLSADGDALTVSGGGNLVRYRCP